MSSLSLQQLFRSPFVLHLLLTLLQWILCRRTIHGMTIDKQLDCQPTDNGDIVCSFRIVSSQLDNPPADDHTDDHTDDAIKQFLTTCVDDVCMYTHVTVRKTKPIIKKEIHNNNNNRNNHNHNNWNENKNKRKTKEQRNDEHDDDDDDDEEDDDDDNDIRPVTHQQHQQNNEQNESVLHIGSASYHPPYHNYGSKVQAVLKRYPKYDNHKIKDDDDDDDNMTEDQPWATFFIQLGNAHLIDVQRETTTTTTSSSTSTLYHAELARNAYQQALIELEIQQQKHQEQPENINTNTQQQQQQQQQLQHQEQDSSIFPNIVMELTATVHFQLGEAYSITDTEQAKLHQETALELYRQLRRDYSDLLQRKKNTTTTNSQSSTTTTTTTTTTGNTLQIQLRLAAMDKSYADTCTKLGMSIHNRAVETSNQSQMNVMVNGLNAAGTGTDGGAGTASINLQDGLGAGFASFGNDFFVEDNNMMSIESLLQMMQQMNNPQTQMELEEQLQHAADYLDEAILIYEQHLVVPHGSSGSSSNHNHNNNYNYNSHHDDWYLGQAMAYQQAATIATTQNQLVRAQPFLQKALDVYLQKVLPKLSASDSVSDTGVVTAIGNLYVSLANTHLQLGQYDLAKTTYSASMDWHRNHRRIPTATFAAYDDTSTLEETLTLYRHQLEEYRRLLNGDGMYYMPQDDTYEGDLLSAMGSLYLNQGGGGSGEEEGDDDEALQRGMDLLQQALELYNKAGGNTSRSSKKTKRSMADTQLNLAMAYFRKRDFDKSIQIHFAALDIYRELYGDGTNPLTRGLEDVEELLQQAGMGDYAEQLKGWIQGSGDSDNGKPSVTVDLEKFQQSSQLRQNVTVEAIPVNRDQNEESTESTEQNTIVKEGEL